MGFTAGQQAIADYPVVNGGGDRADWNAFIKAHSGDMAFACSPVPSIIAAGTAAWSKQVTLQLATADGEVHKWFQGQVTLSAADTSSAGTASISPTGAQNMVDGQLPVTLSGNAAAWVAGETVTITVAATTVLGYTVAQKAFVFTVA